MKAQFHANGRTHMTKRMVACHNFANASKTLIFVYDLTIFIDNSYYTYCIE